MKSFLSAILVLVSVAKANASGGSFFPSSEYLNSLPVIDGSLHPEGLPEGLGVKAFSSCKERIFVKMAKYNSYPEVVQNRANLNVCYSGARYMPSLEKPPAYVQEQFYIRQGDQVVSLGINIDEGKCAEGFALSTMSTQYFDQYIGNSNCKQVNTGGN